MDTEVSAKEKEIQAATEAIEMKTEKNGEVTSVGDSLLSRILVLRSMT